MISEELDSITWERRRPAGMCRSGRRGRRRSQDNSIQLRRARGENFEGKTVRRDIAAGDGKIKVFGNLVVFRQQRKIQPSAEDFFRRGKRQGAERIGTAGWRAVRGTVFQGGKSRAHGFTLVLVGEQAIARAANRAVRRRQSRRFRATAWPCCRRFADKSQSSKRPSSGRHNRRWPRSKANAARRQREGRAIV